MTVEAKIAPRLQFLTRVVRKECQHLATEHGKWGLLLSIIPYPRLDKLGAENLPQVTI